MFRRVERPEARTVCVVCRQMTDYEYLERGPDVVCLHCAREIACVMGAEAEPSDASCENPEAEPPKPKTKPKRRKR